MSEAKRRFFSGDTLRQALVQAANYYDLDPDQVAYRNLEKRHGFIKTRRGVVIEVDPEHPKRPEGVPAPRPEAAPPPAAAAAAPSSPPPPRPPAPERREREHPEGRGGERPRDDRERRRDRGFARPPLRPAEGRPEGRPEGQPESRPESQPGNQEAGLISLPERPLRTSERFPPATGPQAEAAQRGLDLILGIAGLDLSSRIHQGEERLEIELSGPGAERCFDDEGELLLSIEHLLPRVIRSLSGEAVACRVDCDNFHEIREEQLRTLAQRAAEEVRRRGRPRTLEPMNPADRRVVHMTLADDPHVETESEGEGYFKRITIRPS